MNTISRNKAQRIATMAARKMGLDPKNTRPHELLLFAALSTSKDSYTLKLDHKIQEAILPIAEGLQDRDAFVAVAMAVGVLPVPVIATVEYPSAAVPVYNNDDNVFDTAATVTLSESQALASIFWGRHTLQTNEGIRINEAPNLHFLTLQQTQGSASTANMNDGTELKEIGAAIRFGGGDNNQIIINIKCDDKSLLAGPATRNNYLLVRLCGAVIKGATNKAYLG